MSTEYYLQGFKHGEADGIAPETIFDVFGKQESDHEDGFYRLYYDAAHACDFTIGLKNSIVTNICIHRPCGHQKLFASIFDVLSIGPYVLFAPGGNAPILAQPNISAHLPDSLVEALGAPVVVHQASEIPAALFG